METVQMQTLSTAQGERGWAAGVHAGALLLAFMTSWTAGVAGMLAGLAVYFLKKNDYRLRRRTRARGVQLQPDHVPADLCAGESPAWCWWARPC